jgi:hypothetical protein
MITIYKTLPKELADTFGDYGLDGGVSGNLDLDEAGILIGLDDADVEVLVERCNTSFVKAVEDSLSGEASNVSMMVLPPEPWPSPTGSGQKGGGDDGPLTNL